MPRLVLCMLKDAASTKNTSLTARVLGIRVASAAVQILPSFSRGRLLGLFPAVTPIRVKTPVVVPVLQKVCSQQRRMMHKG